MANWTNAPAGIFGPLWVAYAFAIGASLGSFVGLVVERLPRQESIVRPRSHCDGCGRKLTVGDMLPILSWLWLRGRCRGCHAAIGWRTFWVEWACAGLCVALLLRLGVGWPLLAWIPLVTVLLAIALLDIDYFWVPDVLSLPAMGWALSTSLFPGMAGPKAALLGVLPALGVWLFASGYAWLMGREGMGLGDVKLLAIIGLAMGPTLCVAALVLASLQGAVCGTLVLALGGHAQRHGAQPPPAALEGDDWVPPASAIPFGPFLVLGCLQVLLAPEATLGVLMRLPTWLAERLV